MKLSQIRHFIKVYELMCITAAAKELYISQPSLSVSIKKLETNLGVTLFHRSKQKLQATSHADYFYKHLSPIIDDLDNLHVNMVSLGQKSNALKIGIPPMMGTFLFPQIFEKFIIDNNDIDIKILEHGALKVFQLLIDEEIDVTLIIEESHTSKDIHFTPIVNKDFLFYTNKSNPLSTKKVITFEDLKTIPLIMFNKEFYISKVVKEQFKKNEIEANIVLETTQISTIKRFLSSGIASSILIADSIADNDDIVGIPISYIPPITIGLARKKSKYITESMKKLFSSLPDGKS